MGTEVNSNSGVVDILNWYMILWCTVLCHLVVMSPYKFAICDTTGEEFSSYVGGGVVLQVKTPMSLTFVSTTIMPLVACYKSDNSYNVVIFALFS